MNQHIHCIVSDCHYYSTGNKCSANEIVVVSDQFGASQPDSVDASMASELTPGQASTCMETCCKTFVHKNSDKINADGNYKL
ncbi:MAG: DUF1540 domain-containing protein [Desulfotomaculaceae bacterium]|nr:DUF1540 domain-containing protein [Desulfotomaculaceae bacterium]